MNVKLLISEIITKNIIKCYEVNQKNGRFLFSSIKLYSNILDIKFRKLINLSQHVNEFLTYILCLN